MKKLALFIITLLLISCSSPEKNIQDQVPENSDLVEEVTPLPKADLENKSSKEISKKANSDLLQGTLFKCKPLGKHQYYRTDRSFVIDPTDSNIMYINVEHKGFFKSVDGGKTWALKTKGIPTFGQEDNPTKPCYTEYPVTVIDPKNPKHIILALSGPPSSIDSGYILALAGGLAESFDGAETWQQNTKSWMNTYVTDVAIDPGDSNIFYYTTAALPSSYDHLNPNKIFVTKGLVYKTSDGGNSWEELPTGFFDNSAAVAIYLNPKNTQEILVPTYTDSRQSPNQPHTTEGVKQMGLLKSSNGGKTWSALLSLPEGYEGVRESAVSTNNFNHIFIEPFYSEQYPPKNFYSNDGGKNFKLSSIYMDIAKYDPHDKTGNHLLGYQRTTIGPQMPAIYESSDAGATWKKISDAPQEIINNREYLESISNIVWDPKEKEIVYLTGAGGYIWKSVDSGKNWKSILNIEKLK